MEIANLEYFLRVAFAALCGLVIGIERDRRAKQAGMRTHAIVSMGAALMSVVSKYGFFDMADYGFIGLDPSRVMASIVCGIGFLGTGLIFNRSRSVIGLTTAAGIWTTAGIGMAIGAGMYGIGVAATVLVLMVQLFIRADGSTLLSRLMGHFDVSVDVENATDALPKIIDFVRDRGAEILNVEVSRHHSGSAEIALSLRLPKSLSEADVAEGLCSITDVRNLEF